jgi:hypothetical protein
MSTTPDAAESAGAPTSCDPVTDLIDAHTGNRGHRGGLFPSADAPRPWRSINVATVFTVTSVPSRASCARPRKTPRRRHRTRRRPSRPWCPVPAVRQTLAKARRQGCCSSQELVVLVQLGDLKAQGLELCAFIQGQFPGRSAGPGGPYGGDPLAQRLGTDTQLPGDLGDGASPESFAGGPPGHGDILSCGTGPATSRAHPTNVGPGPKFADVDGSSSLRHSS